MQQITIWVSISMQDRPKKDCGQRARWKASCFAFFPSGSGPLTVIVKERWRPPAGTSVAPSVMMKGLYWAISPARALDDALYTPCCAVLAVDSCARHRYEISCLTTVRRQRDARVRCYMVATASHPVSSSLYRAWLVLPASWSDG
jgi:hypothetical protein